MRARLRAHEGEGEDEREGGRGQGDDKAGNAECPIAGGWTESSSKIRTHIRTHVRIRRELYW